VCFQTTPFDLKSITTILTQTFLVAKAGVGMHIEDINRDLTLIYHDFFLTVWIAELLYSFALTATKLAILACYWRIFNVTSIKLPIKVLVTLVISWLIVRVSASCSSSLVNT
jgi:hypothetical protein